MRVYLDIDGVLVSFLGSLHKSLGVPYSYEDYPYERGKWNMLTDIKGFSGVPTTFEQCNDCCTDVFWRNLEWMHDGRDILTTVVKKFTYANEVHLLTTPMPNFGSWTGKAQWVNKHIPVFNERLIISTASKSLLAGPDTLLIDDRDKNVEEFIAAGGQACLVPRPWNKSHSMADKSVDIVRAFLGGL